MKCPNDNTVLMMSDRQGIEIDYCPTCRGVWLDRGELDKIIERSQTATATSSDRSEYNGAAPRPESARPPERRDYDDRPGDYRYKKRKKENFLGDLFDF